MQPTIISIYPWTDFMPGQVQINAGKLMCIIKFNMKITKLMIKNITLTNSKNEQYIHDISIVDGFKYEQRDTEIIIRGGPRWLNTEVTVQVVVDYVNTDYILISQPTQITQTS